MPPGPDRDAIFERIYATDLVYVPDCYRLCGDAHCCNFARYKARFLFLGKTHFQELPLLPGEYEYLAERGHLAQFGEFNHKVVEYAIGAGVLRCESIVSRRQGCACNHATRTTICRLYPFLPRFDVSGRLCGVEEIGIYELLEQLEGLAPACRVTRQSPAEAAKFAAICRLIAADPKLLFFIEAYRVAKRNVAERLKCAKRDSGKSAFSLFELRFLRGELFDQPSLRAELDALADRFQARYGPRFRL